MGYIYKHTLILDCPSKGKSYIGKAVKNPKYRWNNGKGYKKHKIFWAAIQKYGGLAAWDTAWEHEILESNVPKEALAEVEQYYIAKFHTYIRDPQCFGYNMTPGGEGGPYTGKAVLMIDMKTLEVLKEFNSTLEASRFFGGNGGSGVNAVCLGNHLSYKNYYWCYKDNWSAGWMPREKQIPGAKTIYKIDSKTFEIVATFKTIMDAARTNNISKNVITNCAKLQHTPINGYYYLYANSYTKEWQPIPIKVNRHGMKAVLDFEANKEYDSFAAAGRAYNTTATNVYNCCHNFNYTLKNHHFCLVENYKDLKEYLKSKEHFEDGLHIICFETKVEYNSMTEASKATGVQLSQICQCCLEKALTAGGFHWCYKKDYKDDEQWRQAKLYEGKCKKVRCIQTGIIYKSTAEAFRQTGIRHIVECCKGQVKHAGKLAEGTPLSWEYVLE